MSGNNHLNAPKQSRSRQTLERIVQAALEILEGQGYAALTVKAVVERANSSVGSFYARFSGKEDLVDYLGTDGQAYSRSRNRLLGDVAAILLTHRREMAHPEPELAVRLGLLAAEGMIMAARAEPLDPLPREMLVGEATELLLCYLSSRGSIQSAVRGSEEVDFFDVWS